MFRKLITALIFATSPAVAQNPATISQTIGDAGLAAVEATLRNKADLTSEDRFALGTIRFLRGIETTLQLRYRHDATLADFDLPVLRLPVPQNPTPEPFYPGLITDLFKRVDTEMEAAREALFGIDENADFKVAIDLRDLWFDINENASRDEGESIYDVGLDALGIRPGDMSAEEMLENHIVHFDTADAAWLRAYTHVLSAVSHMVVAFDPTDMITQIATANAEMSAIKGEAYPDRFSFLSSQETFVDMFAMAYGAINVVPTVENTSAARWHLLNMVQENRSFWRQVALETDNDLEWLPNDKQVSAFGMTLPEGTGKAWLEVLADGEAVLKGELLVPHWKLEPGGGINIMKLMENPVEVDLVTWVQGYGLLSVMEAGPLVTDEKLRRFDQMFGGDAGFFAIWLN